MTKAAAGFGLSDVGLKKICRKHDIPVPGRGYWRKLETGKTVAKPPLGRHAEAKPIILEGHSMSDEKVHEEFEAVEAQKRIESDPENRITVSETIEKPHHITTTSQRILRQQKPDEYGMLKCATPQTFFLRVGTQSRDRALGILDTFLKALEKRGFKIDVGAGERGRTTVVVDGEKIGFSIEEPSQRKAHRLTDDEKIRKAKGILYHVETYDYVPTGKFTLKFHTPYGSGIQGSFSDTERQRLDGRLNDAIIALVRIAAWEKDARQRRQEKEQRLNEENARRAEIHLRQQEETKLVKQLHEDATAWDTAEKIRRFISAVHASASDSGRGNSPAHEEWLRWAHQQADRIDPLRESPPSILDEKAPKLLSIWEFETLSS